MSGDYCPQKELTVTIQENGIIRSPDGYIIARLNDDTDYDSEHLNSVDTTDDIRKYKI